MSAQKSKMVRGILFILLSVFLTGLVSGGIATNSKWIDIGFYWYFWFAGLLFGIMFTISQQFSKNESLTIISVSAIANAIAIMTYIFIDEVLFVYDHSSLYYLLPGGIGAFILLLLISISLEYSFNFLQYIIFTLIGCGLGWFTVYISNETFNGFLNTKAENNLLVILGSSVAYLAWQLPIAALLSTYLYNNRRKHKFRFRRTLSKIVIFIGVAGTALGVFNVIWQIVVKM